MFQPRCFLAVSVFVCLIPAIARAQNIDPNYYYRFVNGWQTDKSLDVDGTNGREVRLAPTTNHTGQYWRLLLVRKGVYQLENRWQSHKSLDVKHSDFGTKLGLAKSLTGIEQHNHNQDWKLEQVPGGVYRLTNLCEVFNKRTGRHEPLQRSLDVVWKNVPGKGEKLVMDKAINHSGQTWKLVKTNVPVR